jgi:hypothetical protein
VRKLSQMVGRFCFSRVLRRRPRPTTWWCFVFGAKGVGECIIGKKEEGDSSIQTAAPHQIEVLAGFGEGTRGGGATTRSGAGR